MTLGRRIVVAMAALLAITAYWAMVGAYAFALNYCHIIDCERGAAARAAKAREALIIGGAVFVLLLAVVVVLLVAVRRARRRTRT